MSIFSKIKQGRAQAKEHNAKQAEKVKQASQPPAKYVHVPRHAACDAMNGAPPGWNPEDKSAVQEATRDRLAKEASRISVMSIPRVNSSLSYVSYPAGTINPVVTLPRNYSYSSMPGALSSKVSFHSQHEEYRGRQGGRPLSLKGRELLPALPTGVAYPAITAARSGISSKNASPSISSSSSDEILEMKPARLSMPVVKDVQDPLRRPQLSRHSSTGSASDSVHRLHPSHQRRASDSRSLSSSSRLHPPVSNSAHFRSPRPLNPRALSFDSLAATTVPEDRPVSPPESSAASTTSSRLSVNAAGSTAPSSSVPTPAPSHAKLYLGGTANKHAAQEPDTHGSNDSPSDGSVEASQSTPRASRAAASTSAAKPSQESRRRRLSKTRRPSEAEQTVLKEQQGAEGATKKPGLRAPVAAEPSPAQAANKSAQSPEVKQPKKSRWSWRVSRSSAVAAN